MSSQAVTADGRRVTRRRCGAALSLALGVVALLPTLCAAQVEELFSRHIRVLRPVGEFAPKLVKLTPPGDGSWRVVDATAHGFRLRVPAGAEVNPDPSGSRILEVLLVPDAPAPKPVVRLDVFKPQPGEPTEVDDDYAEEYAEEYPKSFNGKFTVTDRGTLVIGKAKTRLAMVGGTRPVGAATGYRLQCAYLSPERQLFVTFDCAQADWERHADTVGKLLLSLEETRKGK